MSEKVFHLGICMAGAVSAGAYTAGVMDFLLEALDEWEKRRGEPDVPKHRVVISVIGGASAGGMTGIMTAAAVNRPIVPVKVPPSGESLDKHPENLFYHTWVDMLADDMFSLMLDKTDIDKNKSVEALLNSSFIDKLAENALAPDADYNDAPPYIAPELKVFCTLTNLEGLKYNIAFKSEIMQNRYNMAVHNDYACFNLNATEYKNDGWLPLHFKTGLNTDIAKDVAMATGAFPAGLKSRVVKRPRKAVMHHPWLNLTDNTDTSENEEDWYITQNVDGGLINNEPFEKVRWLLNDITGQISEAEQDDYQCFKSAVVLIDPFPSEKASGFSINQHLFPTIAITLSAVTQQMRAKPSSLINAMSPEKAGQYLIAPTRYTDSNKGTARKTEGSKAIACGAFDGFSGFMEKEFRIHDYFLGRYNCEMFLRNYFVVPSDSLSAHPLFSEGYAGVDQSLFKSFHSESIQIIPVFKKIESGYYPIPFFQSGMQWPQINPATLQKFDGALKKRVEALLLNAFPLNKFWRSILLVVSKLFLGKILAEKISAAMYDSLHAHGLLKQGK